MATVLDGREIPMEQRVETILARLQALKPGEELVLITPHEPGKLLKRVLEVSPRGHNFAPLEKGPEAWRWQFTAREDEPRSVTDFLTWDHRRLEHILADAMEFASAGEWEKAQARFQEYGAGLRHHIDFENNILFPRYDELTGNLGDGPTGLMVQEHEDIGRALETLLHAAESEDPDKLDDAHAALTELAFEHHAKEEEILLPSLDATLDETQSAELVHKLLLAQ